MGQSVSILGMPMDMGAGRRGVDMGPSAIRYAGLHEKLRKLGHTVTDLGDVAIPVAESRVSENPRLHYLSEVVAANKELAERVADILGGGAFPLVLGGDHSIGIGTLAGVAKTFRTPGALWFDAHGDFNTEKTSPSGNIHGMPVACSVGRGAPELLEARLGARPLQEEHVVLIGVRELDLPERDALLDSKVHVFSMTDIDKLGMREVVARALSLVAACDGVHVSFDLDVVDPREAPGVGTPHAGGVTYREAHLAMEEVAASGLMTSLEVVEVNPILDVGNETARLAAELIASALGQRII